MGAWEACGLVVLVSVLTGAAHIGGAWVLGWSRSRTKLLEVDPSARMLACMCLPVRGVGASMVGYAGGLLTGRARSP